MAENEKTNGFKFAITVLTAFGTVLYVVNNYIQYNAITDPLLFFIIKSIITTGITISGISFVYILIKGLSTGVTIKERWEKLASSIYLYTIALLISYIIKYFIEYSIIQTIIVPFFSHSNFYLKHNEKFYNLMNYGLLMTITLIIFLLLLCLFMKNLNLIFILKQRFKQIGIFWVLNMVVIVLLKTEYIQKYFIIIISMFLALLLYVYIKYPNSFEEQLKKKKWLIVMIILVSFVGLYLVNDKLSPQVTAYFIEGRTTISMDDIYYKNEDLVVPASIEITGLNYGTNITLFTLLQKNSTNYLVSLDIINLTSKYNSTRQIEIGNNTTFPRLIGNAIDDQKYNIFINISDLPVGYYELMVNNKGLNKNYSKGFYISE